MKMIMAAATRRLLAGITLGGILLAPACATRRTPAEAAAHAAASAAVAESYFSGARALDVVAFMDNYFRLPGNTGFDASIRKVEGILKEAGYVEESAAPAGARLTYRIEKRPMRRPAWEPVDASVTVIGEPSPVLQYTTNRNMLAISSGSTPDTGVVAQLIDGGKGTAAELDKLPVAGKIVVAEGGVGTVFSAAMQRGAVGVMTYRMPAYLKPEKHRNSIQFASIPDTTGTRWGIILSLNAFEHLRGAMAKGPAFVRVKTAAKRYPSEELTLIADVHGSVRPDERFVLSAHVQEPGANDNASGVGTLAEVARVLAMRIRRGDDPPRSITMLFGDEITQTQRYLAEDSVRTRGVLWGLSLDMVGENTAKTGGTFLIEKMPDPSAIWTRGEDKHSEWGGSPITKERLRPHYFNDFLYQRALEVAESTGWVVKTNPFEGGSDHTPFLQFNKPGVLFWHFTDEFYHTDGDRLENVSAQTMTNVGNTTLGAVFMLTHADGELARRIVADVERAAKERIATERALSRAALAGAAASDAAAVAKERDILTTWIDYYAKSIESMTDIEVGGSSPQTRAAIAAAAARIRALSADPAGR